MKKTFLKFIHQPKISIPVTSIIAIILGIMIYPTIGNAPKTDIVLQNTINTIETSDRNADLSFPKSGRVESVMVKVGDKVSKGQTLAVLAAPDAKGVVSQTKGALALAEAQYASLDLNYSNTKKQQDTIVNSAYETLLKTAPEAVAKNEIGDNATASFDAPTISGNYTLGKEGTITIHTYSALGGIYFNATGLIYDTRKITDSPVPIGNTGLYILFPSRITTDLTWTITLPNLKSPSYTINKNAYDLALVNRSKVLSELAQNIGTNDSSASVAKAQVDAARGAYEAALGAYQNNIIASPIDGVVRFVDENLKLGQSVVANKTVISIGTK